MRAALADAGIGLDGGRSRPTPATSTATPPAASARCTASGQPASRRQRQQQLLVRLVRALPRPPGRRERGGRLRARLRVRADAARRPAVAVGRPPDPLGRFAEVAEQAQGRHDGVPVAAQYFGGAGAAVRRPVRHPPRDLRADLGQGAPARRPQPVCRLPRRRSRSRRCWRRGEVFGPLTRLQCCPPSCGAAAVVVASPEFAARHGPGAPRCAIRAQAMTTDTAALLRPRTTSPGSSATT